VNVAPLQFGQEILHSIGSYSINKKILSFKFRFRGRARRVQVSGEYKM